jgi:hypothetical protein
VERRPDERLRLEPFAKVKRAKMNLAQIKAFAKAKPNGAKAMPCACKIADFR